MRNPFARFGVFARGLPAVAVMLAGCAAPVVPAGNVVVDADVLDCSQAIFEALGPLDLAIAIDTSLSTRQTTGFDIDGDGSISTIRDYTDRDDSRLSAQVAALKLLLRSAADRDIRFAIVTYSGPSIAPWSKRPIRIVLNRDAMIRTELTDDIALLESVLDEVLERGSKGTTNFYAGMRRSNRSLIESDDPARSSRKLVLFMSDSPGPINLDIDGTIQYRDERMKSAALQARRHQIVFNTFGLSEDSGMWRRQSLGQISGATGGSYHAVEDPQQLYCHLASSLAPSPEER